MKSSTHFLKLYNDKKELHCVLLSPEIWGIVADKIEPYISKALLALGDPSHATRLSHLAVNETEASTTAEPLKEWEELKSFWDFSYPYETAVLCKSCNSETTDWELDIPRKFRLKSAQLGGLAVFHCNTCGATVRKKHFKDHICFEASSPSPK